MPVATARSHRLGRIWRMSDRENCLRLLTEFVQSGDIAQAARAGAMMVAHLTTIEDRKEQLAALEDLRAALQSAFEEAGLSGVWRVGGSGRLCRRPSKSPLWAAQATSFGSNHFLIFAKIGLSATEVGPVARACTSFIRLLASSGPRGSACRPTAKASSSTLRP